VAAPVSSQPAVSSNVLTPPGSSNTAAGSSSASAGGSSAAGSAASNSSTACTTHKGPTEDAGYGPLQVEASVSSSGHICSIKVLQHPSGGRSSGINSYAIPILNSQAMAAQSANIQGVSGATYTSGAYQQSLQAILDSVHG